MTQELPERFHGQVAAMPEYSYGVNRLVVTLDDGTTVSDVFVAWAKEIVKVGTSEHIPFDPTRIIEVRKQ
jgi:hypothetical protein